MKRLLDRLQRLTKTKSPEMTQPAGKADYYLNGRALSEQKLRKELGSILEPARLTALGGILLKAGLIEGILHIGIIPQFYEGQRGYHYDIHLSYEDEFTLIGGITASRELTILFKCPEMDNAKRKIYRVVYRRFAEAIEMCRGEQEIGLDWITTKMIEDQALYEEIPSSLMDIIRKEDQLP